MTETEAKLLEVGTALARSIGHKISRGCPKLSPAVPCTCGAAQEQAKALDDWEHLIDVIEGL